MRKTLNINHKNTHINTIQIKENKQLNIQQKQNYPGSVAFYDSQPGNEVGLFYNGPEHHTRPLMKVSVLLKMNKSSSTEEVINKYHYKLKNKKFCIPSIERVSVSIESLECSRWTNLQQPTCEEYQDGLLQHQMPCLDSPTDYPAQITSKFISTQFHYITLNHTNVII